MKSNSKVIKDLLRDIAVGGVVNMLDAPAVTSYNPRIELEWTSSSPYKLIIHEYFESRHLRTVCLLDDYKGEVLEVLPQEIVV